MFLTGFMGCGKSTLGPPLADELQLGFLDLDDIIAERAGRNLATIFAQDGEAHFRALEAAALRATVPGFVYALGGGALVREDNLQWARRHGIIVFMKVPAEELQRRLEADEQVRPLLLDARGQRLTSAALYSRIVRMLGRRAPYYQRAHITVPSTMAPSMLIGALAGAVGHYAVKLCGGP